MARIVLVHGAFNELWGPNELKARWLPAVRDGLWHHRVEVSEHDVDVCFYGDLFRRHPGTEEEELLEKARPGIAEVLGDLEGVAALAAIADAAGEAVFERTVDMVTVMTAEPEMRDRLRERIEAVIHDDTRVARRPLLRDRGGLQRAGGPSRVAGAHLRHPRLTDGRAEAVRGPGPRAGRRPGRVAGQRRNAGSTCAPSTTRPAPPRWPTSSVPGSKRSSSTTDTAPTRPSPT